MNEQTCPAERPGTMLCLECRAALSDDDLMVRVEGGLVLDFGALVAWLDGEIVHLTAVEWRFLACLAAQLQRPVRLDDISQQVWGCDRKLMSENVIRTTISRIRGKLPGVPLETVQGAGYRLGGVPALREDGAA